MRLGLLTLAVFLLAGCGPQVHDLAVPSAEPAPVSPSPSPSPLQNPCGETGLELTVGEVNAAMGLRAVGITLHNCNTASYTVNGFPVVEILDRDRRKLEVSVVNGTEQVSRIERYAGPPTRIDIAPGGSVNAVLVWRNLTTDQEKAATGAYVSITPFLGQPARTFALLVDTGNTGKAAVSPWTSP